MDMQEWFPEKHPEYGNLETQCAAKLTELLAGGAALAEAFMRDTRAVHGQLYASLTPSGCGEYAGNYRGTAGTSLEKRVVGADGSVFSNPKQVKKHLDDQLSKLIDKVFESRNKKPEDAFNDAAMVFYFFGRIHPYLDGNGHIQRLIFAVAIAQHSQIKLDPSWTIHPRPYGVEMQEAFEKGQSAVFAAVASVLSAYVTYEPLMRAE